MSNNKNTTGANRVIPPTHKNGHQKAMETVFECGAFIFSMAAIACWFVAIFFIAGCLGVFLAWSETHFKLPPWAYAIGHAMETFLFVADCINFAFAIVRESLMHLFQIDVKKINLTPLYNWFKSGAKKT